MRQRVLVSVLLAGIAWHSPAAAQYGRPVPLDFPGKNFPPALAAPKVSPELKTSNSSTGNWGGRGCASATAMKALVDNYLTIPGADFPNLGSPVPGLLCRGTARSAEPSPMPPAWQTSNVGRP
jgi:hypothetical protein